jgi:isopentenyldiphosphate isomerase
MNTEYWDLYDKTRQKLHKTHLRGEKLKDGEYHLSVHVWILNSQNKILLTQRHPEKRFPLQWECTGGAVIAGEDSFSGALREVEEEIGIKLQKEKGALIDSMIREDNIADIYLFLENIDIGEIKLQENEVIDIKWVTKKEFDIMARNG